MTVQHGPLMLDIEGLTLNDEDKTILSSPFVGGLILFSRNFESIEQLSLLVNQVRQVSPQCLIAVDHEGGRVQRFKTGFTHIPPMAILGQLYQVSPEQALSLANDFAYLLATELLQLDIDISFAPVLDLDYGISAVIGDRAFSSDLTVLNRLVGAFLNGMHDAGMATTGKHFPGHGAVEADSHIAIPIDGRSLSVIRDNDMNAFSSVSKNGLDAVMPAHIIYPQVDEKPAGFSKIWLQDILRDELKFDGVIFSDDLSMEGASVAGSYAERCNAALMAGCDMVLVCNNRQATKEVLSHLENCFNKPIKNNRLSRMLHVNRKESITEVDVERLAKTRLIIQSYWDGGFDRLCKELNS